MRKQSAIALFALPLFMLTSCSSNTASSSEGKRVDNATLYRFAFLDSIEANESKIRNLVCLDEKDGKVTWNSDKDAVLMFTFHRFPSSYPAGEEVTITWNESWLCSVKELGMWYKENKDSVNDPLLRVKQLLGMSYESANTHISSFWVSPNDLIRPAYVTDVKSQMALSLADEVSEDYKSWFISTYYYSYDVKKLLWTRLGYTYDWSLEAKDRYGLSEFVAFTGVKLTVEKTLPVAEFLESINN